MTMAGPSLIRPLALSYASSSTARFGIGLGNQSLIFAQLYPLAMAHVSLRNVTKRYDDGTVAVDNVSFDLPDGEFLVIVGPSGCGKSTTLRMIAGLEMISDGEISIGDRVVNDVHPKDR